MFIDTLKNNSSTVSNSDQEIDLCFQIQSKVNGHIQKIRKRPLSKTSLEANTQIQNFLNTFQSEKIPNIEFCLTIKPIISISPEKQRSSQSLFELDLLQEQIRLFSCDQDILSFIQTKKNLSHNVEKQLSELLFGALSLCKRQMEIQSNHHSPLQRLLSNITEKSDIRSFLEDKDKTFVKEKLQELEDKCFEVLNQIKEERRKMDSCCVCLVKKSNSLLFPCMHLCMCRVCSEKVEKCPFCKQLIEGRKVIFN